MGGLFVDRNILLSIRLIPPEFDGTKSLLSQYNAPTLSIFKKRRTPVYKSPDEKTIKAIEFLENGPKEIVDFESL